MSIQDGRRQSFRRRLLTTTETLDIAIAAPAAMGGSIKPVNGRKMPIAKGSPMTL
jgi:hypothetical protein